MTIVKDARQKDEKNEVKRPRKKKKVIIEETDVKEMKKDSVVVAGETIPVSRSQKKNFCADLAKYLGEGR